MGKVTVVVGGQYGSEGKGALVAQKFSDYEVHVRVGSPNAGHTIFDPESERYFKMRSIPCGWINRDVQLVIGAGAIIDPVEFKHEMTEIAKYDPNIFDRVIVDPTAYCIAQVDKDTEVRMRQAENIGSTQEGVGMARTSRMLRQHVDGQSKRQASQVLLSRELGFDVQFDDTVRYLHEKRHLTSDRILVEGTQGSALSLYHGHYPFVTTTDSNAAGILSECGIPFGDDVQTVLVFRTFPIRVAGNSGPMTEEIDWATLSAEMGVSVEERTTVTKKIRRVGRWDATLFERSCMLNNPNAIAIMFADYIDPKMYERDRNNDVTKEFAMWLRSKLSPHWWDRVVYIGTGPKSVVTIT
jgi:adenylosuccinate synthase